MKNLGFNLQQTSQLVITPQLRQVIKLLQLSNLELKELIDSELDENPFLQVNDIDDRNILIDQSSDNDCDFGNNLNDFSDSYSLFEDSGDSGYLNIFSSENDGKKDFIENTSSYNESIYEYLIGQLRFMNLDESRFNVAEVIVFSLNADGYLNVSLDEIARHCEVDIDFAGDVLRVIQSLDPPGIAARDLREVLLLQIKYLNKNFDLAERIIRDDFDLFRSGKYKLLSSKYCVNSSALKKVLSFISKLEPIPARSFNSREINYIMPEVIVRRVANDFRIIIDSQVMFSVKLDQSYRKLIDKKKLNNLAKDFLNEKYDKAKILVFGLKKRYHTIFKVTESIISSQKNFFLYGSLHLIPLKLKDIADKLNMHESTISRAINNKYIETPWGLYSFKYFFSRGIDYGKNGRKSTQSVKEIIKIILLNEKKNSIISDSMLVKMLYDRGITIARRTVAKYRKEMYIDSSYRRK